MGTASTCIPNIGRRERRRRLVMGGVMLVLTVLAAAWLLVTDTPRAWRILIFVPAWIGALDFLQVRAKTCVLLAARGVRNMDGGNERIADPGEIDRIRAQARTVHVQSALLALTVTAFVAAL